MGFLDGVKNLGKEVGQVVLDEMGKLAERLRNVERELKEIRHNQDRIMANQDDILDRLPKRRNRRKPKTHTRGVV